MSYEKIVEYYDQIFPLNETTLRFLCQQFMAGQPILDVACGSGEYTLGLAQQGYQAYGCDLEQAMIDKARSKAQQQCLQASFQTISMEELASHYEHDFFAGLFCIGNSLAHAADLQQLTDICRQCHTLLRTGGILVAQIINYDRIISQNLPGLPTIENYSRNLRFTRHYDIKLPKVIFTAKLQVDGIEETTVNELYAITHDELTDCLRQASFCNLEIFGSFASTPFDIDNSQPLIVTAQK